MKKNVLYLYFSAMYLFISTLQAQVEDPSYIFYNQHQNLVNPAAVGIGKGHTVSVDIRNQWQGVSEAPQTQTFFTTHQLNDRVGLGFSIANNKVFIQKQAGIYADFAYGIPMSSKSKLIGGIKFGGDFFNIDGSRIQTYNSLHSTHYDPYLQTISGKFQINFGMGLMYVHSQSDFYLGISIPNMLASDRAKVENDVMTSVSDRLHFYGLGGYFWHLSPDVTLKPSFQLLIAKDMSPSLNLSVAANYLRNSELGLTYRTTKALNAYVLFHIPRYYVALGYGYEANLQSQLNLYARNSHEFLVQLKF